ncbi:hypothetical protein P7C73_g5273, partial [Tremellales sp. Uapishka_1]
MTISESRLFSPIRLGSIELKHRVVMAPLTRLRASTDGVPSDLAIKYYSQRASGECLCTGGHWCPEIMKDGGLLITEGAYIADEGKIWAYAPGFYSEKQPAAWEKISTAVHAKGGKIVAQLFAAGRVADPSVAATVWGPTDTPYEGTKVAAMTEDDIDRHVEHFRQAALNAIEAGMDGVEVHMANGYLLDQFLQSVSNTRTDNYGGSLENRFRFPLRALNAICDAIGAERVGIRISPYTDFQGMREADPLKLFMPFTEAFISAQPNLAYVHAVEARDDLNASATQSVDSLDPIREIVVSRGNNIKFMTAGTKTPGSALAETRTTEPGQRMILLYSVDISFPIPIYQTGFETGIR